MAEDRANHPGRTPKYSEVRDAVVKGFITNDEAKDLGKTVIPTGKASKNARYEI